MDSFRTLIKDFFQGSSIGNFRDSSKRFIKNFLECFFRELLRISLVVPPAGALSIPAGVSSIISSRSTSIPSGNLPGLLSGISTGVL